MSAKNRRRRPERDSLKISTSFDVFHLFLQRKRAEGLEVLRVFSEGASWKEGSPGQRHGGLWCGAEVLNGREITGVS